MENPNSIVIKKESNGNITVTPEGQPYTLSSKSVLFKDLNGVVVRQMDARSAISIFTVDAVEKVIRADGTEITISDIDTLFTELNTFFFFELEGSSSGGGGLPDNYRVVAGVMRNVGGVWQMITTGGHSPLNVDSLSQSSAQVNVHYSSIGATDVVSFVTGVDDTFAGIYQTGATVGTSVAGVKIGKPKAKQDAHLITHNGNGSFTFPASLGAASSYSTSLGRLRIYHDEATDNNFPQFTDLPSTASEQTQYVLRGSSLAGNRTDVYLYNLDGTQKSLTNPDVNRFYYNRANLSLDPNIQDPANVNEVGGNIWFIGIFKVS